LANSSIQFGSDITPDKAIIHSDEAFAVEWRAFNAGPADAPEFSDELVITSIPEGCPGSDDAEHPVVFSATVDEPALPSGTQGPVVSATVGPFGAGSYRLTVTVGQGLTEHTSFNCIEIVDPI
jgi:hypothetical protein